MSGVGRDGALLAPAYHCRTMLDPAIRLGARLVLYPLDRQLAPDLGELDRTVRGAGVAIRAMLLTHYFGFAQDVEAIKAFCDEHGIVLIEDCSHALLQGRRRPRMGRHANYTTASPYKFFPCEEGGWLIAHGDEALPQVRPAGLRAQLRPVVHALERTLGHDSARRGAPNIARLDAELGDIASAPLDTGAQTLSQSEGTSHLYDSESEGVASSWSSRLLLRLCDVRDAAERRRANYQLWCNAVSGLPNCRALFDRLPDDCVPYMFPLLIEHPRPHFYMLKKLGVPIWRWDDMADSTCAVSQHFREHLLHLPCHQALTDKELAWLTGAVSAVMRRPASVRGENHESNGSNNAVRSQSPA